MKSISVRKISIAMRMALIAGAMAAVTSVLNAGIVRISAPIEYDSTHDYAYAFIDNSTWDQAESVALALSTPAGVPADLKAGLATFTDAQFTWFKGEESSVGVGSWDIAWIGARNLGSGSTYTWLLNQGNIPANASEWRAGEPTTGNYGVGWKASGYGNNWATYPSNDVCGAAIIEYQPVPEPQTIALVSGLGLVAFAGYRRFRKV